MFEWIKKLGKKSAAPARKLGSRQAADDAQRVELAEFAPKIMPFLGLAAYLQLELYEASARAVVGAPALQSKDVLARAAGATLTKHQRLTDEIRRRGHEPHLVMEPFTPMIDRYIERIDTPDWHQYVLSIYLVGGLFDGFFASLAGGLKDGYRNDAIAILNDTAGRVELRDLLAAEIAADPSLANRLALWASTRRRHAAGVPARARAQRRPRVRRERGRARLHRADRRPHPPDGRSRSDRVGGAVVTTRRCCSAATSLRANADPAHSSRTPYDAQLAAKERAAARCSPELLRRCGCPPSAVGIAGSATAPSWSWVAPAVARAASGSASLDRRARASTCASAPFRLRRSPRQSPCSPPSSSAPLLRRTTCRPGGANSSSCM
ncbi:ferritin-like fold-containing protein [Leucobacter soli]|uniref:ferritin-like fold-containing protein n=1 Tax=Leucobacter soli TaxID=2812850 RepID=UPI00361992BC